MTRTCKKYGFTEIQKNAIVWVRNYSKCIVQNLKNKLPASSSLGAVCLNRKLDGV